MGDYIPARQLDSSHIGKTVRIVFDKISEAQDVLVGVRHNAAMISEGRLFEPTRLVPGRIETTITFQQLGEVDCEDRQKVRIVD